MEIPSWRCWLSKPGYGAAGDRPDRDRAARGFHRTRRCRHSRASSACSLRGMEPQSSGSSSARPADDHHLEMVDRRDTSRSSRGPTTSGRGMVSWRPRSLRSIFAKDAYAAAGTWPCQPRFTALSQGTTGWRSSRQPRGPTTPSRWVEPQAPRTRDELAAHCRMHQKLMLSALRKRSCGTIIACFCPTDDRGKHSPGPGRPRVP
jgi:hypothetical protein